MREGERRTLKIMGGLSIGGVRKVQGNNKTLQRGKNMNKKRNFNGLC